MSAPTNAGAGRCPTCGAPTVARYRPFCSRRCADLDLWNWLGGYYRVPTREREGAPDDDTDDRES